MNEEDKEKVNGEDKERNEEQRGCCIGDGFCRDPFHHEFPPGYKITAVLDGPFFEEEEKKNE